MTVPPGGAASEDESRGMAEVHPWEREPQAPPPDERVRVVGSIQQIIDVRTQGWLPLEEWGPVCAGCGGDEFRFDGYCSLECRDFHSDDDIPELASEIQALREQLEGAEILIAVWRERAERAEAAVPDADASD